MESMIITDEMTALKEAYDELKAQNANLAEDRKRLIDALRAMKDRADKYESLFNLMTSGKVKAEKQMQRMRAQFDKARKEDAAAMNSRETTATLIGIVTGFVIAGVVLGLIVMRLKGWW